MNKKELERKKLTLEFNIKNYQNLNSDLTEEMEGNKSKILSLTSELTDIEIKLDELKPKFYLGEIYKRKGFTDKYVLMLIKGEINLVNLGYGTTWKKSLSSYKTKYSLDKFSHRYLTEEEMNFITGNKSSEFSLFYPKIEYKGELNGLPSEIVDKILEYQVKQGNPRDITVFENNLLANYYNGGFSWYDTENTHEFWRKVLVEKDFNLFYRKYLK